MYTEDVLKTLQRNRERVDLEQGAARYLYKQDEKAKDGGESQRDEVQRLMKGAIPIVAKGIREWTAEAEARKGRPSSALAPIKGLDADLVAFLALSKTFNTVAQGAMLQGTAKAIGQAIQIELEAKHIKETDPKAAERFLKMVEGGSTPKAVLDHHGRLLEALSAGLCWGQRTQVLVGGTVLNIILTSLDGVFERAQSGDARGTLSVVRLSDAANEHLLAAREALAWMRPILAPMVCPPRPWTRHDTGAYLEPRLSRAVPLVRTHSREQRKMIREAVKDGSMAEELAAVNAIQETRFAIDARVLAVMEWVKEEGHQPAKSFPLTNVPASPERHADEEWASMPTEKRIAVSRKAKSTRNIIRAASTNKGVYMSDIEEARFLSTVPAFYLPHSMDFRGRVYAVPHFNPQRSDHIKALFRFADRHPMGPHGGKWLMVHLANCGDFKTPTGHKASKAPFDERVQWVRDNEEFVLRVAADPQGSYGEWAEADSPFCFLQACFEYAEWAASGYSEDFMACISAALDGSCSGLQHYAAMTRSEKEAVHVNLVPTDKPGDVYQVVADAALPTLQLAARGVDLAAEAAGIILARGFGRSEVKRNVMTYFYGSGKFGMRDQHMKDTMLPLADEVALGKREAHPYEMITERKDKETGEMVKKPDGGYTCANILAAHVYHAVVSVAPKADEAANWFQSVSSALAHESHPVIWRTPTGLPVIHSYPVYTQKVVNMWLYDRSVKLPTSTDKVDSEGHVLTRIECTLREPIPSRIDKRKAVSAISPNVVHSLDASHLKRTVLMARAEGITAFQLIHDSFATHLGQTERFFGIIREAFVHQYETYCPFTELETYARGVLSVEGQERIPATPEKGELDIKAILGSPYAFA